MKLEWQELMRAYQKWKCIIFIDVKWWLGYTYTSAFTEWSYIHVLAKEPRL